MPKKWEINILYFPKNLLNLVLKAYQKTGHVCLRLLKLDPVKTVDWALCLIIRWLFLLSPFPSIYTTILRFKLKKSYASKKDIIVFNYVDKMI